MTDENTEENSESDLSSNDVPNLRERNRHDDSSLDGSVRSNNEDSEAGFNLVSEEDLIQILSAMSTGEWTVFREFDKTTDSNPHRSPEKFSDIRSVEDGGTAPFTQTKPNISESENKMRERAFDRSRRVEMNFNNLRYSGNEFVPSRNPEVKVTSDIYDTQNLEIIHDSINKRVEELLFDVNLTTVYSPSRSVLNANDWEFLDDYSDACVRNMVTTLREYKIKCVNFLLDFNYKLHYPREVGQAQDMLSQNIGRIESMLRLLYSRSSLKSRVRLLAEAVSHYIFMICALTKLVMFLSSERFLFDELLLKFPWITDFMFETEINLLNVTDPDLRVFYTRERSSQDLPDDLKLFFKHLNYCTRVKPSTNQFYDFVSNVRHVERSSTILNMDIDENYKSILLTRMTNEEGNPERTKSEVLFEMTLMETSDKMIWQSRGETDILPHGSCYYHSMNVMTSCLLFSSYFNADFDVERLATVFAELCILGENDRRSFCSYAANLFCKEIFKSDDSHLRIRFAKMLFNETIPDDLPKRLGELMSYGLRDDIIAKNPQTSTFLKSVMMKVYFMDIASSLEKLEKDFDLCGVFLLPSSETNHFLIIARVSSLVKNSVKCNLYYKSMSDWQDMENGKSEEISWDMGIVCYSDSEKFHRPRKTLMKFGVDHPGYRDLFKLYCYLRDNDMAFINSPYTFELQIQVDDFHRDMLSSGILRHGIYIDKENVLSTFIMMLNMKDHFMRRVCKPQKVYIDNTEGKSLHWFPKDTSWLRDELRNKDRIAEDNISSVISFAG